MTRVRDSQPPSRDRTAYLVLGMHRSGTSAMTQILALAGARLPNNVMPGDAHNEKGYFEPWRIATFNDERLRAAGGSWDDPFVYPYVATNDEVEWQERARQLFRQEFKQARYPLLKDPRVSVLLPLWRPVIEAEGLKIACVIPVRHPLAVARSLSRRDQFPPRKSVLLWLTYMVATEAGTRDLPRAFVDYDALVANWRAEVGQMEDALGTKLPRLTAQSARQIDGFIAPELRHNRADDSLAELGEVGTVAQAVFDLFKAACRGSALDKEPLERAATLLGAMKSEMGDLVSPVSQALDQTKLDLATARALLDIDNNKITSLEAQVRGLLAERLEVETTLDRLLAD
jgi:hypothetical protein